MYPEPHEDKDDRTTIHPLLDVIIPVKDRGEIGQSVQSLLQCNNLIGQVLVCDGGSTDAQCLHALQQLAQNPQVKILQVTESGFNKSRLINRGIANSTAEVVLIADADILWSEGAIASLLNCVITPHPVLCHVASVEEADPDSVALSRSRYTFQISTQPDSSLIEIVSEAVQKSDRRPGCGLICAARSTLLQLGGYKEMFQGWGWEDQDLLMRAILLGVSLQSAGQVLHLSHTDAPRNRFWRNLRPSQTRDRNLLRCLQALQQGQLLGDLSQPSSVIHLNKPIQVKLPWALQQVNNQDFVLRG